MLSYFWNRPAPFPRFRIFVSFCYFQWHRFQNFNLVIMNLAFESKWWPRAQLKVTWQQGVVAQIVNICLKKRLWAVFCHFQLQVTGKQNITQREVHAVLFLLKLPQNSAFGKSASLMLTHSAKRHWWAHAQQTWCFHRYVNTNGAATHLERQHANTQFIFSKMMFLRWIFFCWF